MLKAPELKPASQMTAVERSSGDSSPAACRPKDHCLSITPEGGALEVGGVWVEGWG